jgi:hypothetical protein
MFKVFFLTVLLLCSCSDIGKEAKLSKIKALQSKLSKNKKSFEAMKVDTLFIMKQRSSDLERKLKQNYKSDSVDLNLGRRIDDYKRMRRMFGPLGALGTKLSNAFNEESLQLQHLYYDVENGFGPRDKYDEYIRLENKKCGQISILLADYLRIKTEAFEIYAKEHRFVVDFVQQILKKE